MAGEFSVPSHTIFFDGYLDAVGRHFTDDEWLCAISVAVMPAECFEGITVKSAQPVENMVREFERDIAKFLDADPRTRLLFYLTEYFDWYQHFSGTCVCERVCLEATDIPENHIAYRLFIDSKFEVLFLGYWKNKIAIPGTSLERTRGE